MRTDKLVCPSCGANIDVDTTGRESVFCSFCGTKILIDNGTKTTTKNININIHKRYTDDAAIEEIKYKDRKDERDNKFMIYYFLGLLALVLFMYASTYISDYIEEKKIEKSLKAGWVSTGYSASEIEGKKYQSVVEELEEMGFTNIKTIDLDDAGIFFDKPDTIESIKINGNSSFEDTDYFDPDSKIIISYH